MVGKLQCDSLTNQLLDYFMDEHNEATMKGPQYVFYLHIVLKNFDEATKVASLIATQEQVNYVGIGTTIFHILAKISRKIKII